MIDLHIFRVSGLHAIVEVKLRNQPRFGLEQRHSFCPTKCAVLERAGWTIPVTEICSLRHLAAKRQYRSSLNFDLA